MSGFCCVGADLLTQVFMTEYELLDRLVGSQLWGWGCNVNGQLGTNNTTTGCVPVPAGTDVNWVWASAGSAYATSSAIKTDGTLWMWGLNDNGQVGTNLTSTVYYSSPVQTVSGGSNWRYVSTGGSVVSLKTDGSLWTWGDNTTGQLGDNSVVKRSSPVQTVATGTNWEQISSASIVNAGVSAGIKTNGSLWLWGCNGQGQLGSNNITNASSPVQTISAGTSWSKVSVSTTHSAAIKTDGTLWLWGNGANGRLGNQAVANVSSPIQTISSGTTWKQVSLASTFSSAIKIDGTLWTWGCNVSGSLGNNVTADQSSPVQTIAGGTSWKQVSASNSTTMATRVDGTLWGWGDATAGKIGDNTITARSSPVQTFAGGTNWKQVSVGIDYTLAVTFSPIGSV